MADPELAALRAKRLAELQQQSGAGSAEQAMQREAEQQQMNSQKNDILSQILDQNARARLNGIALVKPETAQMVEANLIQMATSGRLRGKVTEEQLKDFLGQVSERRQAKRPTVNFVRRKAVVDDDSDSDD